MFTTNTINSWTDQQHLYASSPSGSTNPFRRSPSVSPQQNSSTTPALNIDFQGENPFDVSALQGTGLNSCSSNPTTSTGNAVSDIPLEFPPPPPPPAYVRTEESSSTAPVSPTTISTFETSVITTAPSGSTQAQAAPPIQPEPVNEYVLKPIDWIDPATSMERRIKIITQNGRIHVI